MKLYSYLNILFLFAFMKVSGQQGSPVSFSTNYLSGDRANKQLMLNSNFSLNVPIHRDTLFTGLLSTNFKYFKLNLPEDSLDINNLYSWSVPLTGILRVSTNKMITLKVEPIISSDFKDIGGNNFRYNIFLFYGEKDNLNSWGIGLVIAKRYSGFQMVPFGSFNFHLGKNWILSGIFPFKDNLIYEINKTQQIGISFGANNNSFRLSKLKKSYYINSQLVETGIFYQRTILKHFRLNVFTGLQFLQAEVWTSDQTFPISIFLLKQNKSENAIESFKNNGLSFQISFSYSLF